jgi:TRAP-type C4-dicarboxylate transport system substrate-binding protein
MKKVSILLVGLLLLSLVAGTLGCGGGDEAAATPTGGSTPAPTVEPVTLKMVTSSPGETARPYFFFAELVEQYTDGRVEVDVYPDSQLFPGTEQWEALVTGAVDIFGDSVWWFSSSVPDVMLFYIDGVFESYEHAYAAMEESDLTQILSEKIEAVGPVKNLGMLSGSMAIALMNNVRETKQLKDLEGLRCQGHPGTPSTPIYDYSGMTSIPIAIEEVASSFITGVVDAVQFPPPASVDMMLYEPAKHALFMNSMFFAFSVTMHNDAWDSLPADIQDIILNRVMPEVYDFTKQMYREQEDAAIKTISENVETANWVTQEDFDAYIAYADTHAMKKVQLLMIDPAIMEIIEDARPSNQ